MYTVSGETHLLIEVKMTDRFYKTFGTHKRTKKHTETKLFLDDDGNVDIARYESYKYQQFEKLTKKQLSFFWIPEEVDLSTDKNQYEKLEPHAKHIFTSNLRRQILLDSVQGRSPNVAFLPLISDPTLETWVETWAFSETIHSRSYTHIIRNLYADPSPIFDELTEVDKIVECAQDVSKYYDDLIYLSNLFNALGEGEHVINGKKIPVSKYELKKRLWLAINSVNILEGIRFYVSFACSWAFAENKLLEGNAKIIKFICRDENLHLASTQNLLSLLPKDDPDFAKIKEETANECLQMFMDANQQEKDWADYLFKDGSIIGLNAQVLKDYVDWITAKRIRKAGLKMPYSVPATNPLPWTSSWIASDQVQVAPQEAEISSYVLGGTNKDYDKNSFKGFDLNG